MIHFVNKEVFWKLKKKTFENLLLKLLVPTLLFMELQTFINKLIYMHTCFTCMMRRTNLLSVINFSISRSKDNFFGHSSPNFCKNMNDWKHIQIISDFYCWNWLLCKHILSNKCLTVLIICKFPITNSQ